MYAIYKNANAVVAVREVVDMESAQVLGVTLRNNLSMELRGFIVSEEKAVAALERMEHKVEVSSPGFIEAAAAVGDPIAQAAIEPCQRCNGTGIYIWGEVRNGRPTRSGTCYDCAGKGWMSAADKRRDVYYHNHQKAI